MGKGVLTLARKMKPIPMGHRLRNHDGLCRYLHGHNYDFTLTIAFKNPDQLPLWRREEGFLLDFAHFGKLQTQFDRVYDHSLLLHKDDPLAPVLLKQNLIQPGGREFARIIMWAAEPTVENIAATWGTLSREWFEKEHPDVYLKSIQVWETERGSATVEFEK